MRRIAYSRSLARRYSHGTATCARCGSALTCPRPRAEQVQAAGLVMEDGYTGVKPRGFCPTWNLREGRAFQPRWDKHPAHPNGGHEDYPAVAPDRGRHKGFP